MLQAAIAACHARARDAGGDRLGAHRRAVRRRSAARTRSPIVRAESRGRGRHGRTVRRPGWRSSTRWPPSRRWRRYHLLPSVRGDLLERLGRLNEARAEFERAAGLTKNSQERALLLARAHTCAVATVSEP